LMLAQKAQEKEIDHDPGDTGLSSRSRLGSSPTASPRNALEGASPPMKRQRSQKSIVAIALILFAGSIAFALRDANRTPQRIEIVVALDGSGQFKSVQDAIMSVPSGSRTKPVVIHIKPGVYRELIYIQREKRFFHLIGEDAEKTLLTFDLQANMVGLNGKPITTFRTPSTVIDADDVT